MTTKMKAKTLRNTGAAIAIASTLVSFGHLYSRSIHKPQMSEEIYGLSQIIESSKKRISQVERPQLTDNYGLFADTRDIKLPDNLPEEYVDFFNQARSNEVTMLNGYISEATNNPAYKTYKDALRNFNNAELPNDLLGFLALTIGVPTGIGVSARGQNRMKKDRGA